MQGIGQGRSTDHSLEGIAAAIGQLHALARVVKCLFNLAHGEVKLAQIARVRGRIEPDLLCKTPVQGRPHCLGRLTQPSQCPQVEPGLVEYPSLVCPPESCDGPGPGWVEEARQGHEVGAYRPKLVNAKLLVSPPDPWIEHFTQYLLVATGVAAVGHRREQRRHLIDGVGELLGVVS